MFHASASQNLMRGPSCTPTKHFLRAPGMTMEMQSFSYQSWEPEDRSVFPGMQPIRKEMEGTQDVLSTAQCPTAYYRGEERSGEAAGRAGVSPHHHFPCYMLQHDGVGFPAQVFHNRSHHCFFLADICQIMTWPVKYSWVCGLIGLKPRSCV